MHSPSNLKLRLNRMHPCALGYGRRFGIWMQGCSLACHGCCSMDTWHAGSRHEIDWSFFAAALDYNLSGRPLDGVTISGGEPFQQREALHALVHEIRAIQSRLSADWDIMVYTGYAFDEISADEEVLRHVDVIIAGPYDATLPKAALRGSNNQTLHRLSERARTRYTDTCLPKLGSMVSMDVAMPGNDIVIAGLPESGDFPRLERALSDRGVTFRAHSWRDTPRDDADKAQPRIVAPSATLETECTPRNSPSPAIQVP